MPTFNQLVRKGRTAPRYKTASPALQASPIGASPSLVGTIALVTTIATSVAVYQVAQRIGFAFLYYRPRWARLLHDASQ